MEHNKQVFRIEDRIFTHEEICLLAVGAGMDKKAHRPVVLDLRALGAFAEFFVVMSASNRRQVYAVADGLRVFFREHFGLMPVATDGLESCDWVLIDYGYFFVHIFQDPTRDLYQLEQLWSKGRLLPVEEAQVNGLLSEVKSLTQTIRERLSADETAE